ncbi:MAG: hypothetical protein SGCHY_000846 [Lobulomycetales sp.]
MLRRFAFQRRCFHCYGHGIDLSPEQRIEQVLHFSRTFSLSDFPRSKLNTTFVRSSGPGGQNVNKVSTKAQCSLHIDTATWIPVHVRTKLKTTEANRMNKRGELIFSSDRNRTQLSNLEDCIEKIYQTIMEAAALPKDPSEEQQEKVKEHKVKMKERSVFRKQERSRKKQNRKIDF